MPSPILCVCSSEWRAQTYTNATLPKSFGHAFPVLEQLKLIFGASKRELKEWGSVVQTKTITRLCNPKLHFSDWVLRVASK